MLSGNKFLLRNNLIKIKITVFNNLYYRIKSKIVSRVVNFLLTKSESNSSLKSLAFLPSPGLIEITKMIPITTAVNVDKA